MKYQNNSLLKLVIVVCVIFSAFSCSDENEPADREVLTVISHIDVEALRIAAFGTEITELQALEIAGRSSAGSLRSAQPLSVTHTEWVKTSTQPATRSTGTPTASDSIPIYFVYNPASDKTTIVSGDNRLPEVLAEANGRLSTEKTGTGYDGYISLLPHYIQGEIANKSYDKEAVADLKQRILFTEQSENKQNIVYSISPASRPLDFVRTETEVHVQRDYDSGHLLKVKWDQGYPDGNSYNFTIPQIDCGGKPKRPFAGCVAVALAQIISQHRSPNTLSYRLYNYPNPGQSVVLYEWTPCDWNILTSYTNADYLPETYQKNVSDLMYFVGRGVGMKYKCDGSSSNIDKAKSFLNNIGYKSDGITENLDYEKVVNSIVTNRPVYIRGKIAGDDAGHAWVVDGVHDKKVTVIYRYLRFRGKGIPSDPINPDEWSLISEDYQFTSYGGKYCNFGWGGFTDGLFYSRILDYNNKVYEDFKVITNIRP